MQPPPSAGTGMAGTRLQLALQRDSYQEDFGLEISGGRDAGRALLVSAVYPDSPAHRAGLAALDIILAVDDIPARNLSHADTVDIFRTALDIRLKIERPRRASVEDEDADGIANVEADMTDLEGAAPKVPRNAPPQSPLAPSVPLVEPIVANGTPRGSSRDGSSSRSGDGRHIPLNNQAYAWIDVQRQPCSPPPEDVDLEGDDGSGLYPTRKAALLVSDDVHLGLLIRGGSEYGLGVYVTGLDKASAAENAQLKVGDQILTVNNHDFRHIPHSRAVRILRTHRHMTLTVRHVGKLPYARRLSPSTTTQSPSKLVAPVVPSASNNALPSHSPSLAPSGSGMPAFGTFHDPLHEEVIRLTREANQEMLYDYREHDPTLELLRSLGLHDVDHTDTDHDIDAQLQQLESDWANLSIGGGKVDRRKYNREKPVIKEHWLGVVEASAEALLEDDSQKEALMYFLTEYINGSVEVDALVLSLFHLMDSTHKLAILDDIRNLITPPDIARYDSLTSGMKAEWMMSPAKLFAGITPSASEIGFFTPGVTPPLTNPVTTGAGVLKSALKSPSASMSFPDAASVNPYLYGLTALQTSQMDVGGTGMPSQSGALSAPLNNAPWPNVNLVPPTPLATGMGQTPLTPTITKFVYDAPSIEMDMFGQRVPVMTSITASTAAPSIPQATGTANPGPYLQHMPAVSPLIPGRKSQSTDNVPYHGQFSSTSAYELRGEPYGRPSPRRGPQMGMPGGSSYSIQDPYIPPGSYERRHSPPQPPPGRMPRPPERGRRASNYQYEEAGGPRGSVGRLYPPQSRWHSSLGAISSRERDAAEQLNERRHGPDPDGSISPVYSYSRSRSNSGDLHSEREYGPVGGGHRKFSYDDDMMSAVDMPFIAAKQRPHSLQVQLENKIGPAKGDAKTPVVIETVVIKKNAPVLGIAIEGGTDTKQPLPRIINIQPKGCAHLNGNLKVGHVILSINGRKMDGLNHGQAVNLITETFLDKSSDKMEFIVKEVNKLEGSS